jgi:uncharacterized membrane protein YccC
MGRRPNAIIGAAIGGAAYGFIVKSFPQLPTMPLIGKSGTVAALCYFFGGRQPLIRDIGIAAASIAGYTLATQGKIEGGGDGELYAEG